MANYDAMSEEELRLLLREQNAVLNALRTRGELGVRELRAEVLRIHAACDTLQQKRYKRYEDLAEGAESAFVQAEAASAVSAAERIISGS